MKEWSLRHLVRLSAVVVAGAPVVVALLDTLPWDWAVSLSAGVLTAGETAQRLVRAGKLVDSLSDAGE
jgi:hypothetical protein